MKPQLPQPERFTLPANETGNRLATSLVTSLQACGRTATLHCETFEVEGHTHHVLVVEAGSRPNEGNIAREMKAKPEKPLGRVVMVNGKEIRTSVPEHTPEILESIKRTQPFWDRFK